ncbi:type-II NADH dehydrogenase [Scenedesmus sp. NREL 46B-D3]|nr:type-II NADH dehydrogenase [Scenedesmus sp. NREL 46B-D3]
MLLKVLVIGGGFAGAQVAIDLAKCNHVEVTLVTRTDFFEVSFANARSVVEPSIAGKALWLYEAMKSHGNFIQEQVVELNDGGATLADGRQLPFDYAAIATGSSYAVGKSSTATTLQQRLQELQGLAGRVQAARSVLVVGGGPLGVELAGEVLTDLPGVEVTLVHGGQRLLPSLTPKASAAAEAWLRSKGCKLLLGDKLEVPLERSGGPFNGTTAAGVAVSADVLLLATGITTNSGLMAKQLPDAVDPRGCIKVDHTLRVVGHPRLFALGDVTDVPEEKLAFLASQQGQLVAASIAALATAHASGGQAAANAAGRRLGSWRPSKGVAVMVVTLGRNYAVGRIGCLTLSGWLPTLIKARHLGAFVDKYRRQLLAQP